jgi:hypothetical protein
MESSVNELIAYTIERSILSSEVQLNGSATFEGDYSVSKILHPDIERMKANISILQHEVKGSVSTMSTLFNSLEVEAVAIQNNTTLIKGAMDSIESTRQSMERIRRVQRDDELKEKAMFMLSSAKEWADSASSSASVLPIIGDGIAAAEQLASTAMWASAAGFLLSSGYEIHEIMVRNEHMSKVYRAIDDEIRYETKIGEYTGSEGVARLAIDSMRKMILAADKVSQRLSSGGLSGRMGTHDVRVYVRTEPTDLLGLPILREWKIEITNPVFAIQNANIYHSRIYSVFWSEGKLTKWYRTFEVNHTVANSEPTVTIIEAEGAGVYDTPLSIGCVLGHKKSVAFIDAWWKCLPSSNDGLHLLDTCIEFLSSSEPKHLGNFEGWTSSHSACVMRNMTHGVVINGKKIRGFSNFEDELYDEYTSSGVLESGGAISLANHNSNLIALDAIKLPSLPPDVPFNLGGILKAVGDISEPVKSAVSGKVKAGNLKESVSEVAQKVVERLPSKGSVLSLVPIGVGKLVKKF